MPRRKPKKKVAPAAQNERVIQLKWNRPQSEFMKIVRSGKYRFIDMEGGIRSGKTFVGIWAIITLAIEYPGIKLLIARWTGDSTELQLKPKFYELCPPELFGKPSFAPPNTNKNGWNSQEECQYFANGSMIYIRSLKTSDDKARYAKFTGLTLASILVDQPEECPEDIIQAIKGRLSQKGFPQMLILTPNPPGHLHWICTHFPENNNADGHFYLHSALDDNVENLGEDTVRELKRGYTPGTAMWRRMIEGRRGLSIVGEPVYKNTFHRDTHVREIPFMPEYPVYESWDFGQRVTAVTWHQLLDWGWWNILGEYNGQGKFIDQNVPLVAQMRNELFPNLRQLNVCCDPAGAQGQGARHTSVEILNQHLREVYGPGNAAKYLTNSNRPEQRAWCIQQISSYMGRLVQGRPALLVHPRCSMLIDGFEAGYVYVDPDRAIRVGSRLPNFWQPRKDGVFDHGQNTVEYLAINYLNGPVNAQEQYQRNSRARLHQLQRDIDPADSWGVRRANYSRAGY